MRNFFSVMSNQDVRFMNPASVGFMDEPFIAFQRQLTLAMEATPGYLTAGEEETLASFIGWWKSQRAWLIDNDTCNGAVPDPVFAYHNLNTGKSCVCIAITACVSPQEGNSHIWDLR